MIFLGTGISIPDDALQVEFIRASGPGGQNVNKVATAVQLTLDLARCPELTADIRQRLALIAGRRLSADGRLTILARRHRSQERNRADALERITELIRRALTPPRPRRPTRPTLAARERRMEAKRQRGSAKTRRRLPAEEF